jgi:hypothetical protein
MRFKTCRRQQKFNINSENCAYCWFVLYNYITIHIAKNLKLVTLVLLRLPVAVAWQNTVKVDSYCQFCRNYCLSIDVSPSSSAGVEIEWSYTPTLSLYDFVNWTGMTLPFTFLCIHVISPL